MFDQYTLTDLDKHSVSHMKKQIKIFASGLEQSALDQFNSAMEQDYALKGALMPDAHTGYSLPIGGVVATDSVVVPAWVGYDIGCGMCAIATTFSPEDILTHSKKIFRELYDRIPVGFNVNKRPVDSDLDPDDLTELGQRAFHGRKGFRALGSLGSGNHFVEIGADKDKRVWIIIHSGSRGVGHGLATEYMKLASGGKKAKEGHFGLEVSSSKGQSYINDMNWALKFALANRKEILTRVFDAISAYCAGESLQETFINRNHNHAEEKDGMWIHRKGATHAEEGMMGVIPGNMRDGSFIVKGKGNPLSLWSSSHGAGRILGRKQAKRNLNVADFIQTMDGIQARVGKNTLDEAPMAYKNIFDVMKMQKDMVEVCHHVIPIINMKG